MGLKARIGVTPLELAVLSALGLLIVAPFLCWPKSKSDDEVVTLWAYQTPTQRHLFQKAAAEFERRNPGIKVKIEEPSTWREDKKLVAMQAGAMSDVIYVHFSVIPIHGAKNALLPLNEFIERDNYDMDDFFPIGPEAYTYNGQLMAIPHSGSTILTFYNKKLFDAAGVAYPSDDWTWEDFLEAAKKLTIRDKLGRLTQIGCQPYQRFTWIWSGGGEVANDDFSEFYFTSPESLNALQFYTDLRNRWRVASQGTGLSDGTPSAVDYFENGHMAMSISGPWSLGPYLPIKDFEWDIALVPKGPGGRQTAYAGVGFSIWSGTKKKELAWRLIKFLCSKDGMNIFCEGFSDMPARRSVTRDVFAKQETHFDMDTMLKSMDPEFATLRVYPRTELWQYFTEFYFSQEHEKAILGKKTLEEGMRAAETRMQQYMSRRDGTVTWGHYLGLAGLLALAVGMVVKQFKTQQTRNPGPRVES